MNFCSNIIVFREKIAIFAGCGLIYNKRKMRFRRLADVLFIVLAAAAVISCKDDDKQESLPSLNGSIRFSIPTYISPESTHTIKVSGVTHPEGKDLGFYWRVFPSMAKNDSTNFKSEDGIFSFTHKFSDTLKTYTVYCGIFASGYYSKTASASVTVVDGGLDRSITEAGLGTAGDVKFTDPRDGKTYFTREIGQKIWFRQNLAYTGEIISGSGDKFGAGIPYDDAEAMGDVLGMFYTHNQALNVCPAGWRLPSDDDFIELAKTAAPDVEASKTEMIKGAAGHFMVNAKFNGTRMWEYWPTVTITNSTLMSAIPTGYALVPEEEGQNTFDGIFSYAGFWTGDTDAKGYGIYRYIYVDKPDIYASSGAGSLALPVRCIKDKQ